MNDVFREHFRRFVLAFFDNILVYRHSLPFVGGACTTPERCVPNPTKTPFVCKDGQMPLGVSASRLSWPCYLAQWNSSGSPQDGGCKQVAFALKPQGSSWFLSPACYYRKFVKGYRSNSAPLNAMLKKGEFQWNPQAERAFEELKKASLSPSVLEMPNFEKEFVLECNASATGIGAVLMQDKHPIAYLSQGLKSKALSLSAYEEEMMSISFTVKKWRKYLLGRRFIIRTDQKEYQIFVRSKMLTEIPAYMAAKVDEI